MGERGILEPNTFILAHVLESSFLHFTLDFEGDAEEIDGGGSNGDDASKNGDDEGSGWHFVAVGIMNR